MSVTFLVGAMEACGKFILVTNEEAIDTEQIVLMIVESLNMTKVGNANGSGSMVINIVSKNSRKYHGLVLGICFSK